MRRSTTVVALVAFMLVGSHPAQAEGLACTGEHPFTPDDTLQAIECAARDTAIPVTRLTRIVSCETGGKFNPYAVGDHGSSIGAVQLNANGARKDFYDVGYDDPFNPYQSVYFLAESLRGDHPPLGAKTWSCK